MHTLLVGHTTHDRYGDELVAGGCAYYGARVLDALDRSAHLLTAVGEDFQCDDALSDLDRTVVREGKTTLFTNLYPEDAPRLQLLEAQGPALTPEMAPDEALEADHLHLAPVLGDIDLEAWVRAADPDCLSIGVQGWIKEPGPHATERGFHEAPKDARIVVQRLWDVSRDVLDAVDVACLSDEDLRDQGDLFERLTDAVPIVARTHGDDGATIHLDGTIHRIDAYPTDVADPTGAGDTFAAAFLARWTDGASPVEAGRFASACASIVVEGRGAEPLERLPDEAPERAHAIAVSR